MFIDRVDWDICYQLIEKGFKIYRVNYNGLLHEVGKGKNGKLFGKKIVVYNEPPFRHYYIARNNLYLYKKHPDFFSLLGIVKGEVRAWFIILLFEDDKLKKFKARIKGINDYKRML